MKTTELTDIKNAIIVATDKESSQIEQNKEQTSFPLNCEEVDKLHDCSSEQIFVISREHLPIIIDVSIL